MQQIIVRVRDRKKADALRKFLKTLDYVESVSSLDLPETKQTSKANDADFFALAGLWAGRDITQESLRKQAWPGHV
jgi:hypothetical protein